MSSISFSVSKTPLQDLPDELKLAIVRCAPDSVVALLGQTSQDWRRLTREHPRLHLHDSLFAPSAAPGLLRAAYLDRIVTLVDESRPELLSRFVIDLKSRSPNELTVLGSFTADSITPMMCAAKAGAFGVVRCLFSHGALASTRDSLNRNATAWANEASHRILARWLHASVAYENGDNTQEQRPPTLGQSVKAGHVLMTRTLLAKETGPLSTDLLHAAVEAPDPTTLVTMLLQTDDTLADRAESAAINAIEKNNNSQPTVALLAGPLNKNNLMRAAAKAGQLSTLQYLQPLAGANLHYRDADIHTLLFYAAANGHLDVVKYLVAAGVRRDITGDNALAGATKSILDDERVSQYDDYGSTYYTTRQRISPVHESVIRELLTHSWPEDFLNEAVDTLRAIRAAPGKFSTNVMPSLEALEKDLVKKGARRSTTDAEQPTRSSSKFKMRLFRR